MPKVIDLELTGKSLVIRLAAAAFLSLLSFAVLYYIPANLAGIIQRIAGVYPTQSVINTLISSLVSPQLPLLGLVITILVFMATLLNGSKVYGPILTVLGLTFIAYITTLFHGGSLEVTLPQGIGVSGSVKVGLSTLMLLFTIPAALTLVKGVVITVARVRK